MNYKKYSLEQLDNWVHDAISSAEASPQEVYDTIKKVVEEQYYHHKDGLSRTYELLALLNGNGKAILENMESCSKDDPSPECQKAWNDFWEESNDYKSLVEQIEQEGGYEYTPLTETPKVNKWVLPVEIDDASGEYFVSFPNDMLNQLGWKEGDMLEYVDNKNGTFTIKKSG